MDGKLTLEDGTWLQCEDYAAFKAAAFQYNLLTFCPAINELPDQWLLDLLQLKDKLLYARNRPTQFVGISMRQGRYVRRVGLADCWPLDSVADLRRLRALFDVCQVDPAASPGALCQALMRRYWPSWWRRIKRPPWQAWQCIHDNAIGGRADLLLPGEYPEAWEVDQSSAYAAALAKGIPAGHCIHVHNEGVLHRQNIVHAFLLCRWRLGAEVFLPLGLLPEKVNGIVGYPIDHDWHESWITWEEAQEARKQGYELEVVKGYAWSESWDVFGRWAREMDELKRTVDEELRTWVKVVIVAGIGRFAMDRWECEVVDLDGLREWKVERIALGLPTRPVAAFPLKESYEAGGVVKVLAAIENHVKGNRADLLNHVANTAWSRSRLATWRKAIGPARRGRLISTDFDAIYVLGSPGRVAASGKMGTWKARPLSNFRQWAPRWVFSDERLKAPGLPQEERDSALAWIEKQKQQWLNRNKSA